MVVDSDKQHGFWAMQDGVEEGLTRKAWMLGLCQLRQRGCLDNEIQILGLMNTTVCLFMCNSDVRK